MTCMAMLWKITLLVTVMMCDSFDIYISDSCDDSYYIQSQGGDAYFLVKINRTFYDCSSMGNSITDEAGTGARANNDTVERSLVSLGKQPQYQLFYNTVSQRIEANVSWEFDSTATNYILQLKMMNKGRYFKNCLDIDVTKEKGYFYGKHTFPTEVFARCLGMWSDSVESYFITVLRNQSRNCTCPASQNERESKCKILCARKQGRKTTSYNFNFIRDACYYWSQNKRPNLRLDMKHKSSMDKAVTIFANSVNPYTDVTVALFENENSRFPLLDIGRPRTKSTSLVVSRVSHSNHTHFYAVIYYFCNGSNRSATVSYMSNEVHIENVIKLPTSSLIQDTMDETIKTKNRSVVLGTLIAVFCIAIGLLIASVLFYKNKNHGFRRPKATTESSEDKMWEELHLNNTETHNEDAILQSDVAFTIDSEKDTLGFPDEKDFQHTEQSNG